MKQQELDALMHGEIDGANSPEESQRLHNYLGGNAEARRQYQELSDVIAVLESVAMREPSPSLRRTILSVVQGLFTTAPVNAGAGRGLLRRWGAVLMRRPGYGYAFAAGLVLGIVVLAALGPRVTDLGSAAREGLYGTSMPGARPVDPAKGALAIDRDGVTGGVRCWREGDRTFVRVDLDAVNQVQVVVESMPALRCDSFQVLEAGDYDLVTRPGSSRLHHAGRGVYEFALVGVSGQPSMVTVRIHRDGSLLGEQVFALR